MNLDKLVGQLDKHIGIGIALYKLEDMISVYENDFFSNMFISKGSLGDQIESLDLEKLKKRLSKGREYTIEYERQEAHRKKIYKISFSAIPDSEEASFIVKVIDYTKEKELEYMIDSYAKMAEKNKRELEHANKLIQEQNERMKQELEIARKVQLGMLPFNFDPESQHVELAPLLKPANEVGGDFFDIFYVNDDHLCICLGDVSDKGAGPALFMAASKTLIKSHAINAVSVAGIVSRVNNELCKDNERCMFTTLFVGILNIKSGELIYSNCGHCRPFLLNENKRIKVLKDSHGPALGIIEGFPFSESKISLSKNESILVYSDGVTEASNQNGDLFGEEKLKTLLSNAMKDPTAEQIVNLIFNSVNEFEEGTHQSDDITLLTTKYLG